jgi:hypothetical protein
MYCIYTRAIASDVPNVQGYIIRLENLSPINKLSIVFFWHFAIEFEGHILLRNLEERQTVSACF